MATLVIHGIPLSTYVRTCRMACMEKGVPYELDPVMPQSDEQKAMQPWGSVPAMTHGDVRMYESVAICNYIDNAFDGPPLQPVDPLANARCWQWTSVFIQYLYRPAIDIVLQRLIVPAQGGEPDEALVESSVPKSDKALVALDGALDGEAHFAGDDASHCRLHGAARAALSEDDARRRETLLAPREPTSPAGRPPSTSARARRRRFPISAESSGTAAPI